MTWPWGKLFKEFILGAQNLFFSLFKKKKREKEKAIIFQGCWIYATAKSSPGWELIFSCGPIIPDFLLFCCFFKIRRPFVEGKKVIRK